MIVNLVAQVCMHNEVKKGNLDRCLDNLRRYCDRVIIYDDASTDDSVAVAEAHGCWVIKGEVNNQCEELAHKQILLDAAMEVGATHLFWLDCDEVLDRPGTMGGLRELCENWPNGLDAYSFPEINLWRSQTWQRLDSLFTKARFVRLWKVKPNISFNVKWGVHKQLYPVTIRNISEAPYGIIHYGFWDYKQMMVKIGVDHLDANGLQSCAEFGFNGQGANWILDERECSCRRVPDDIFPPGTLPPDIWHEPEPRPISSLIPYSELLDDPSFPLMDKRALAEWDSLYSNGGYHGSYDSIHTRNMGILKTPPDVLNRASLFKFDPNGKVIVDLACGGGWFTLDCIKNGAIKVYGLDINQALLVDIGRSFQALGIQQDVYKFLNIADLDQLEPSSIDLVYSVALFMHLPFWQAVRYFQWITSVLRPGGEAYLQFYQKPGKDWTMFWSGTTEGKGDNVTTIRLDNELRRAGLVIESKCLAEGEGILPVWQMYRCKKI